MQKASQLRIGRSEVTLRLVKVYSYRLYFKLFNILSAGNVLSISDCFAQPLSKLDLSQISRMQNAYNDEHLNQ